MNPNGKKAKGKVTMPEIYEAMVLNLNSFLEQVDLTSFKDLNYFQGLRTKYLIYNDNFLYTMFIILKS